jgi:2-polyprenyl-3-methyl-5-hydroxy-6-metoxy-1,4-benzoquinol methylase
MGDREIALARASLAERQLAAGAYGAALESMLAALRLAPALDRLWAQFGELVRFFNFRHPAEPVREPLARALEHPAVDPGDLVRPITSLALSHPQGALAEPLLLRLLEDVVIRDPGLERLLTEARRKMLDAPLPLPVMTAIAHQCFNTEYVFDETPEERARIERMRPSTPQEFTAYAAYRPIEGNPIASLARRQIDEPREERRLAAQIPSISEAKTEVSVAVQAQYEANPYPRWIRLPAPIAIDESRKNILIAGCGTGQHALSTARRFPNSKLLAVDLSRASLAYALRKTRELGVANIEYRQADILALSSLDERFDVIECSGVLHHMEDPYEGWRILRGLLKPDGRMRVGLYSELGRRTVVQARQLIAERGLKPDAEGIRACRAALRAAPDFAAIMRNEDFYSMSGCRDLLFHVQEHRFSLAQIETMLARLGLRFLGFELADSQTLTRYRARFGEDTLANWQRFEEEFPDTFARMYQFWVQPGE